MPAEEWKRLKLGDITSIQLGKMLDAKRQDGSRTLPYLRAANVSSWGKLNLTDLRFMDFSEDEDDRFTLSAGDLVVSEGGDAGRCAVYYDADPIHFQKAVYRVRPNAETTSEFLRFYLEYLSQTGELESYCTTTTIKHLPTPALRSIELRLPDRESQRRIVDLLSSADHLVDKNRSEVESALQLSGAALSAEISRIEQKVELGTLATFPTARHRHEGCTHPYLSFKGLADSGKLDLLAGRSDGVLSLAGDTVVSAQGHVQGWVGKKVSRVLTQELVAATTLAIVRPQDGVDPRALNALLRTPSAKSAILRAHGDRTSAHRPTMSKVLVPDIRIASAGLGACLDSADAAVDAKEHRLHAAKRLRDQLLHDLLSGALTIPESYDRFLAEAMS